MVAPSYSPSVTSSSPQLQVTREARTNSESALTSEFAVQQVHSLPLPGVRPTPAPRSRLSMSPVQSRLSLSSPLSLSPPTRPAVPSPLASSSSSSASSAASTLLAVPSDSSTLSQSGTSPPVSPRSPRRPSPAISITSSSHIESKPAVVYLRPSKLDGLQSDQNRRERRERELAAARERGESRVPIKLDLSDISTKTEARCHFKSLAHTSIVNTITEIPFSFSGLYCSLLSSIR